MGHDAADCHLFATEKNIPLSAFQMAVLFILFHMISVAWETAALPAGLTARALSWLSISQPLAQGMRFVLALQYVRRAFVCVLDGSVPACYGAEHHQLPAHTRILFSYAIYFFM